MRLQEQSTRALLLDALRTHVPSSNGLSGPSQDTLGGAGEEEDEEEEEEEAVEVDPVAECMGRQDVAGALSVVLERQKIPELVGFLETYFPSPDHLFQVRVVYKGV